MKKTELENQVKYLKKELSKVKSLSLRDTLTGLYNRRKLGIDIKRNLEKSKRTKKINYTYVMLDIDNFKAINDKYGHIAGDLKLKEVANTLKQVTRKVDKKYRLAGDEFIVSLYRCKNIKVFIKRLKKKLLVINIKVSIGYDILKKDILEQIDANMYQDKNKK